MLDSGSKGLIGFTSSPAGQMPSPLVCIYGATKAYITEFALSLAPEVRYFGVDVVVAHPSPVQTRFYASAHNIGSINVFKATASGPENIVNYMFSAAVSARCCSSPLHGAAAVVVAASDPAEHCLAQRHRAAQLSLTRATFRLASHCFSRLWIRGCWRTSSRARSICLATFTKSRFSARRRQSERRGTYKGDGQRTSACKQSPGGTRDAFTVFTVPWRPHTLRGTADCMPAAACGSVPPPAGSPCRIPSHSRSPPLSPR